jgi:hypothetical protein
MDTFSNSQAQSQTTSVAASQRTEPNKSPFTGSQKADARNVSNLEVEMYKGGHNSSVIVEN